MRHDRLSPRPVSGSMLSKLMLGLLLGAAVPGMAMAQAAPAQAPVATDSRVKTFVYNENDVYNLLTYYGFQSNVEFGPKETIETVSIGDRAGWQVVPAGRRLFIRAVANELHTNMTVVTNLRAYQFDLRATDPATVPQEELVYVIRFFYPDEANRNAPAAAALVPAAPAPLAYPTPAAQPTAYTPPPAVSAAPLAPLAPAPGLPATSQSPAVAYPTSAAPATAAPITSYAMNAPASLPVTSVQAPAPRAAAIHTAPAPALASSTGSLNNRYGAGPFDTPLPAGSTGLPQQASAPAQHAQPASLPAGVSNPAALNFNYTYTGENTLLPYALFDDGKRTYFQFHDNTKPPQISALDNKDKVTRLKSKREGDYVVVATVASRFALSKSGKKATVFNETRQ